MVVVIPVLPIVIAEAALVPMLIVPLVAPVPALMLTFPPLPPVEDSAPAVRFNAPPVPPVPDSNPPVRLMAPPVPAAALFDAG